MTRRLTSVAGHKNTQTPGISIAQVGNLAPHVTRSGHTVGISHTSQVSRCKAFIHELGQVDKAPVAPEVMEESSTREAHGPNIQFTQGKYPKTDFLGKSSDSVWASQPDVGCLEERVEYIQVVNTFMLLLLVLTP